MLAKQVLVGNGPTPGGRARFRLVVVVVAVVVVVGAAEVVVDVVVGPGVPGSPVHAASRPPRTSAVPTSAICAVLTMGPVCQWVTVLPIGGRVSPAPLSSD